ncbi:hypothetical protein PIB30_045670 [Stylosanthes scabra]|uniref:Uncharacterized protein n=1 Tax=Stylosanthes scabra TaxID=79078 RepID=A0ABU6QFZ0_9FABA|nr:hypothetical protein [Stylosanthes scabra]
MPPKPMPLGSHGGPPPPSSPLPSHPIAATKAASDITRFDFNTYLTPIFEHYHRFEDVRNHASKSPVKSMTRVLTSMAFLIPSVGSWILSLERWSGEVSVVADWQQGISDFTQELLISKNTQTLG